MPLPIQSFDNITQAQAQAVQANSNAILDTSVGSVILALIEANSGNSIWLQALATQLLSMTRLSTSSGIDVDTFIGDFGLVRNQGNPSSGSVTFSRFTTTVTGTVPVGALIAVSSNNLTFTVTLDTANGLYNPTLNAYVMPIDTASVTVPCVCSVSGLLGNVVPGAINTIINPALLPGVDTVTNEYAFTNGANPWSDSVTKQEFQIYIQSLSRATKLAIAFAVTSVSIPDESVVRFNEVENYTEEGVQQYGFFYIIIDNGSGTTVSDNLLNAVIANVELYRGLTILYQVTAATFIETTITISYTTVPFPTNSPAVIEANIKAAIQAYAATIPFNEPFLYSKISELVYEADPNVASIPSLLPALNPTLNASNADVPGTNLAVFANPTVTVTPL